MSSFYLSVQRNIRDLKGCYEPRADISNVTTRKCIVRLDGILIEVCERQAGCALLQCLPPLSDQVLVKANVPEFWQ